MRYILKSELTISGDRLDMNFERKKGVKGNSKFFCSDSQQNGVSFSDLEKTTGRVVLEGNIKNYILEKFEKLI